MTAPRNACATYPLAPGVLACAPGLAFIEATASLLTADAHFAYEDVIGAMLPMWSTLEGATLLTGAAARLRAREIVILGDIVHGPVMSESAALAVRAALQSLRAVAQVTLVVGNHEGRKRALDILGETHDTIERDGWTLLHGDRPQFAGARTMIGHLHPSLRLGANQSAPVFLAASRLIVLPALTPYSSGLGVTSRACAVALRRYGIAREGTDVIATTADLLYPFGDLADLCARLASGGAPRRTSFARPRLGPG